MTTSMDALNSLSAGQAQAQQSGTSMDVLNQVEANPNAAMGTSPPAQSQPEMVSQGRDRWGNEIRIPKNDTAGSLVGPLAIPTMAVGIAGSAGLASEAPGMIGAAAQKALPSVRHVMTWAQENPIHAYMVFQLLKEAIPGMKKAMGIVKAAPEQP